MDRHAFDAAAARYSRRVFTFASYLLGNPGEAEDVTQEVLIRLWKRGGGIEPDRLGSWLLTVTRNACIDLLRKHRRTAEIIPIRHGREPSPDRPCPAPSPERLAAGSELGARILRALNELSEPGRSLVVLREIQGLSYREIGEIMEIPVGTLKVTLHRARRRLRESLKEEHTHAAAG